MAARNLITEYSGKVPPNGREVGFEKNLLNRKHFYGFVDVDEKGELIIEQSPDRQDWYVLGSVDVDAGDHAGIYTPLILKWARVKFENDGIANNIDLYSSHKEDY